jgi:hypothetical protein
VATKIDLLTEFEASSLDRTALERVRLDESETAIIPFTTEAEGLDLHYCKEPDLTDYIACNGKNCILCQIGRAKTTRHLLPVFLPASGLIGVLPVSPSLRPRSLWPQLAQALKDGSRKAIFVSRVQGDSYTVTAVPLQDDVADGAEVIKTFLENHQKGTIELASVFPMVTNEQLAAIPEIDRMLKLRGIKVK